MHWVVIICRDWRSTATKHNTMDEQKDENKTEERKKNKINEKCL